MNDFIRKAINLIGSNFRNAIMDRRGLDYSFIYEADFTGAVLNGVNFNGAELDGAIFDDK